ncbi:MAG: tetratricopeptide repeat protein [Proteobacteria bacterium]|nr:tetratricopeptide repeat protein [Pseudomonadota bacterium]
MGGASCHKLFSLAFFTLSFGVVQAGFAQDTPGDGKGDGQELNAEQREEAKGYFISGSESFEVGNYRKAIDQFRKAFEIVRSPEILYNIGRCHEELGEAEEAIYQYEMYLRFYPTDEDAENVRHRISVLRELENKKEPRNPEKELDRGEGEERPESDPTEDKWWTGVRVGVQFGLDNGVTGRADGMLFPIEMVGHFPLKDWLLLSFSFNYAGFFNDQSDEREPAHSQVGLFGGARTHWPLSDTIAIMTRFGIAVMWVDFADDSTLTWLSGRAGGGIVYQFVDNWCFLADLLAAFGPLFGDESRNIDTTAELEVGLHIGMEYVF